MLVKLMKYELKATGRTLIPLYGILLASAVIARASIGIDSSGQLSYNMVLPIMMFIYGITIAAVFVTTIFVIVKRFYKNLLSDEGYLMNTLPIPIWKNILNKLLVALIWSIVSGFVAYLSILIIVFTKDMYGISQETYTGIIEFASIGTILKLMISSLFSFISGIMLFYVAISIGHLAQKARVFLSFLAYIGLSMISSTITGAIVAIFISDNYYRSINAQVMLSDVSTVSIITDILLFSIYFAICNYILKNKLNLE